MIWKIIQVVVGFGVTFWLIYLGEQNPEWTSIRNPYAVGVVALLAVLFVTAIPVMISDLRRVAARVLHRNGEQSGAGKKRTGGRT